MNPLILQIPTIAITGSSGKTTTREMVSSILEQKKWKVLKNTGNKNLPNNTQQLAASVDRSVDAVVLELGMGQPGAGEKHCSIIQPSISVITNIGTAHYGNLGNSIESTAKFKSVLIKLMKQDGILLLNNDDENSKLLDIKTFPGTIITIGIGRKADYQASEIKYLSNGMKFQVLVDNKMEEFYIPTFGMHNVYNSLFAIAIAHRLHFSAAEIKAGLENYSVPIKRLNLIPLKNESLLIDDTVNAYPQSVKAAIDVMTEIGNDRKKIAVLGSMLELGEYSEVGHKEIGRFLAERKIDVVFLYGKDTKWIRSGAIDAGFDPDKIRHFKNRDDLHQELKESIERNSLILVKGSSSMNMHKTVKYLKERFYFSITFTEDGEKNSIFVSSETFGQMEMNSKAITLHFGKLTKKLTVKINEDLRLGEIIIPRKLTNEVSIPPLPYDCILNEQSLLLGPVIGMLVYQRYMDDPKQQILRFANYGKIKGLIFLFRPDSINKKTGTISGWYYNPLTNSFLTGTFPYPSVIFNRIPLREKTFKELENKIGPNIFNYPYGNTNKLDFWKVMSKQPLIRNYFPKTKEYKDINSVIKALDVCGSVYLKPATMAGGNGIFNVKKVGDGYIWADIHGNRIPIQSKEQFSELLKGNLVKNKTYIVQEDISTFNKNQNKIDFRLYLQKDYTKNWRFSGIETKVGEKGSIIANSKNREKIIPGEDALKDYYGLSDEEIKNKLDEITQICIRVLKIMEKKGSRLGDASFDLIMDQNQKFLILELQLNYAAEIKAERDEGEQRILPSILPTPFEYAKALSGF